jgi:hypothetical protein
MAVLLRARWGGFGWVIRLVVLAAMFGCPFVGCGFFGFAAAGRGRMLCEAGDPRFFASRASFGEGAGRFLPMPPWGRLARPVILRY